MFLCKIQQYCKTGKARARKIQAPGTTATKAMVPFELQYIVYSQYLTFAIALGFIPGVPSYSDLTNKKLRAYMD